MELAELSVDVQKDPPESEHDSDVTPASFERDEILIRRDAASARDVDAVLELDAGLGPDPIHGADGVVQPRGCPALRHELPDPERDGDHVLFEKGAQRQPR